MRHLFRIEERRDHRMKRIGRVIFNSFTMLSLLLGVGICVLWARSYWQCDQLRWVDRPDTDGNIKGLRCGLVKGEFFFCLDSDGAFATPKDRRKWLLNHPSSNVMECYSRQILSRNDPPPHYWQWKGFFVRWGNVDSSDVDQTRHAAVFPLWMPVAATFCLPLIWLLRTLAENKLRPGRCWKCGYDLRASPQRCPECGMTITTENLEPATETADSKAM